MTSLDLGVMALYLLLVVGVTAYVALRQRTTDDYYVAGRSLGAGYIAASILATQVSAVSLIGGPAFVARGGGLVWLQYELAVPLATIALVAVVAPVLRRGAFVTIYDYAGQRFGPTSRVALALVFLLARSLASGVVLYAVSLPLAVAFGFPLGWTLLAIGGFSVLYTTVGGIRADVFTDVLQLVVLVVALLICAVSAVDALGGLGQALALVPADRTRALVLDQHGLGDGATFAFWPMVLGGFFLYVSYYGFDQSQAQRLLATRSVKAAQQALVLNGLLRFPLAALYCFLGLLLAAWLAVDPQFGAAHLGERADALVPHFLMEFAPAGIRGLFIAGLFAAAMSTLDSSFNSLSAVTLRDVMGRTEEQARSLWLARGLSLLWGTFCTGSAFLFARSSETVIESINRVGSLFYGPVLGLFVLGMLSRTTSERAGLAGLSAGLGSVAAVWWLFPQVSWMWWNPLGFLVTCAIALLLAHWLPGPEVGPELVWRAAQPVSEQRTLRRATAGLLVAFVVLVVLSAALPSLL
ncbi:MAG TPA: sodium/solute symporter [Gemmatimonadales bacterium]